MIFVRTTVLDYKPVTLPEAGPNNGGQGGNAPEWPFSGGGTFGEKKDMVFHE